MTDSPFAHAWVLPHEIDEVVWGALRCDATRVLRAASGQLESGRPGDATGVLRGPDGLGLPNVSQDRIAFNGSAFRGEAGDPFVLERRSRSGVVVRATAGSAGRAVHRCDTRGQPYDLAACALLLTAQWHLGDAMRLGTSGGIQGGWRAAAAVVRETLGRAGQLSQNERGLLVWASTPVAPMGARTMEGWARNSA